MIQRLYVNNFRCLDSFELEVRGMSSALLVGSNGSGKSTVAHALRILQSAARGRNRVGDLAHIRDFGRGRADIPIRLEIEALIASRTFKYELALELPPGFRELRVCEEGLSVDGAALFSRKNAQVTMHGASSKDVTFSVDWHLVALPIVNQPGNSSPLETFRLWLARMMVLSPMPALMTGESRGDTLEPVWDGSNLAEWFTGLLGLYPACYGDIDRFLRGVMPDFELILNSPSGPDSKTMTVRFKQRDAALDVCFNDLSDGEKCFFVSAVVVAANRAYGPLVCFWDEPDSFLCLSEVGHFVVALRQAFLGTSQVLMTSHSPEAIRRFSRDNTFILTRKNHLEPTIIRPHSEVSISGDLANALVRGDIGNEL